MKISSNRCSCKKCGLFLFEIKKDGYIEINTKTKKYATNGRTIKVICKCGEEREEKL